MEGSWRRLGPCIGLLLFAAGWTSASEPPVALLGALDAEVQPVLAALTDRETVSVLGISCALGKLDGRPAVVAATGVGKVNAAMTTATNGSMRNTPSHNCSDFLLSDMTTCQFMAEYPITMEATENSWFRNEPSDVVPDND